MIPTTEVELTQKADLPAPVVRRGITESQWRAMFNLFPGGSPDSVLMVWDYCITRKLDPLKKPCHIVPMDYKDAGGTWRKRDVVMPGIYEYRITAQRTGLYLGHTEAEYGPELEHAGVKAPAWCAMTFYRWNDKGREKVPFPVKIWFAEVVATGRDGTANTRWSKAPIQMLTKCTEAAGLRETFPEEFGGEATAEEMDGQRAIDITSAEPPAPPQPAQRKSQQTPAASQAAPSSASQPPAAPSAPDPQPEPAATAPASAPANVGMVTAVDEKPGGTLITLSTGFRCATNNASLITAAKGLKESQAVIELGTRASKTAGNAPILEEIQPVGDGQ